MNHLSVHHYGSYFYSEFDNYLDEIDLDADRETQRFDCEKIESSLARQNKDRRSRHKGHQYRADKYPPPTGVFI